MDSTHDGVAGPAAVGLHIPDISTHGGHPSTGIDMDNGPKFRINHARRACDRNLAVVVWIYSRFEKQSSRSRYYHLARSKKASSFVPRRDCSLSCILADFHPSLPSPRPQSNGPPLICNDRWHVNIPVAIPIDNPKKGTQNNNPSARLRARFHHMP